jgi:putative thioredoxin
VSIPQFPSNLGRAIDLSGLGKAPASNPTHSSINEVNVENFVSGFVERSMQLPVFLLVYSDRSPASIELRNLIAKMAEDDGGSWLFGAINADNQPEIIQALQVQSVPFALAFIAKQPIPLFDRIYPEDQIRLVIKKVFEMAVEQGMKLSISNEPEPPMEPEEIAAMAAIESGDFSGAAMAYRNWLQRSPNESLAKIGLAQCELNLRVAGVDAQSAILEADQNPQSVAAQKLAADLEMARGEVRVACERLLNCIAVVTGEDRLDAKNHLLTLFSLIDPADPDLIKSRNKLASVLY